MGGNHSRNKGRRGEQQLVLYLSKLGYKAERVLNQAHTAGLYDVTATKKGVRYSFENKCYRDRSRGIYSLFETYEWVFPVLGCFLPPMGCVAISKDFELLASVKDINFLPAGTKEEERAYKTLSKFNVERGSADFLVIKDDRKARLFLRYWV